MRKVAITLIAFLFVAAFVICGKTFAQKAACDSHESVKALEAAEPTDAVETTDATETTDAVESTKPTETLIPYSAPYNSPDTGADPVEVVEDSE